MEGRADLRDLYKVELPLTVFVLADEGLVLVEPFGDISLTQALLDPDVSQQCAHPAVLWIKMGLHWASRYRELAEYAKFAYTPPLVTERLRNHNMVAQASLFETVPNRAGSAPAGQLLKWIGNKQRMAEEIVSYFPTTFATYHEPFVGSGAVLATLAPECGRASDSFGPLIEIWKALKDTPEQLTKWYARRWHLMASGSKVAMYHKILDTYNSRPNGADLLFLCRSCYGGVVRFRKDGFMSTPCGAHRPIPPGAFAKRVRDWHQRVTGTVFEHRDYQEAMEHAQRGDIIYCDPPYSHSQSILYGGQDFSLEHLFEVIARCKKRGVFVALSIDGTKQSGKMLCDLPIPKGLFAREIFVHCGRSMLKRFQMNGRNLKEEVVTDRLLLTH